MCDNLFKYFLGIQALKIKGGKGKAEKSTCRSLVVFVQGPVRHVRESCCGSARAPNLSSGFPAL